MRTAGAFMICATNLTPSPSFYHCSRACSSKGAVFTRPSVEGGGGGGWC